MVNPAGQSQGRVRIGGTVWALIIGMWAGLVLFGFVLPLPETAGSVFRGLFYLILIAHALEGFVGVYFAFQARENPVKWYLLTVILGFPAWTALRRAARKSGR